MNYKEYITEVPDFPKPGISFKDISPLLENRHLWNREMMDLFDKLNGNLPDYWVGIDSRGFLLSSTFMSLVFW